MNLRNNARDRQKSDPDKTLFWRQPDFSPRRSANPFTSPSVLLSRTLLYTLAEESMSLWSTGHPSAHLSWFCHKESADFYEEHTDVDSRTGAVVFTGERIRIRSGRNTFAQGGAPQKCGGADIANGPFDYSTPSITQTTFNGMNGSPISTSFTITAPSVDPKNDSAEVIDVFPGRGPDRRLFAYRLRHNQRAGNLESR